MAFFIYKKSDDNAAKPVFLHVFNFIFWHSGSFNDIVASSSSSITGVWGGYYERVSNSNSQDCGQLVIFRAPQQLDQNSLTENISI